MTQGRDDIGQRSETVRRANLGAIVRELHARGPLSRSELVRRTGLTRSAIRVLTGELAAAGFVSEGPAALLGAPGPPVPSRAPCAATAAVVLALEIAVDSLGGGGRRASAAASRDGSGASGPSRRRPSPSAPPASPASPRRVPGDRSVADVVGIAVAVAGRGPAPGRPRVDGAEPRLAGRAARRDWRRAPSAWPSRSPSPTRRTSARWPSCAAARPAARPTSCSSPARSASAAGSSRRAGRSSGRPGTAARSATCRSARRAAVPLRLGRLLGDRGRRWRPSSRAAAGRREAASPPSTRLLRDAAAGDAAAHAPPSTRSGAGSAWGSPAS